MSVETGDNETGLKSRVIEVEDVYQTERGGHDVLVVEDTAGNEYSTLKENIRKEVLEEKDKYVGKVWEILFTVTRNGFLNFYAFTVESDEEPNQEEIDPSDYDITQGLDDTDIRITRQSAGHGATRIVQGMIENGAFSNPSTDRDEFREEVKDELQHWTDYLKSYYRTGKWGNQVDE